MNLALLILDVAVFLSFTVFVAKKYGVQKSISASIHKLTDKEDKYYSFFIIGVALPLMIVSNNLLGFLAGALLCIDAAAPSTNDSDLQMFLHSFGADAGMVLGLVMLGTMYNQWYLVGATAIFALGAVIFKLKNKTWWIETACWVAVMTGLFIANIF
jgi:hypothetical protein